MKLRLVFAAIKLLSSFCHGVVTVPGPTAPLPKADQESTFEVPALRPCNPPTGLPDRSRHHGVLCFQNVAKSTH